MRRKNKQVPADRRKLNQNSPSYLFEDELDEEIKSRPGRGRNEAAPMHTCGFCPTIFSRLTEHAN